MTKMSPLFKLESLLLSVFPLGCSCSLLLPISIFCCRCWAILSFVHIVSVTFQVRFFEVAEGDISVTSKLTSGELVCKCVYIVVSLLQS